MSSVIETAQLSFRRSAKDFFRQFVSHSEAFQLQAFVFWEENLSFGGRCRDL
jgi:hypothetical protein